MKLRKVKWNNHSILGNLNLDFTDKDGHPYNTIVFAGENGCGKTTIMDTIATFLNLGSFEPFDCIEYEIDGNVYNAVIANNHDERFPYEYDRVNDVIEERKLIRRSKNVNFDEIQNDKNDIRHDSCVYSRAKAHFPVKKVTAVTVQDVDMELYNNIDWENDFTSVKQLLVDIQNQDEHILYEEHTIDPKQCVSLQDVEPKFKMERFKSAFASFFDNKIQYSGIVNDAKSGEKEVYFKKGKDLIKIDDLSTGEKQIIYRGVYLLKNINRLSKGLVFIDEPEISMHPLWQKKIFKYYRDLFPGQQLFFATHSEEILKKVVEDRNVKIIILGRNDKNEIESKAMKNLILPIVTGAEINYLAFKTYSVEYHIMLYGLLENKVQQKKNLQNVNNGNGSNQNMRVTIQEVDKYIDDNASDSKCKNRSSGGNGYPNYKTLCTLIRNQIDHPNVLGSSTSSYTEDDLKISTEELRGLCQNFGSSDISNDDIN